MVSAESLAGTRFFVIEDDPDHQKIAEMTLQSAGVSDITFFSTGEEAIDFFESRHPEEADTPPVILIDLMLPQISGLEILRHLQGNKTWQVCKKVVLTCSTSLEDQTRSLESGADAFFSKPFSRTYLQKILDTLT